MTAGDASKQVSVWHLDVFARSQGGGNPCPVVLDADDLCTAQMQALAAGFGEETGFVLRGDDTEAFRFRFFVPNHEMSMCVHASVAAVTVLLAAGRLGSGSAVDSRGELRVGTSSGTCQIEWDGVTSPQVSVEQQRPWFGSVVEDADRLGVVLAAGLAADALDPRRPVRPVSVSRAKLMVPLRQAELVHAVDPDLPRLWALCRKFDSTGAYFFAPHPDGRADHLVARQFPVEAGYPEDAATGVAAGALAAYLAAEGRGPSSGGAWHSVEIDQGDAMGRPSVLLARAFADATGVHRSVVTGTASIRAREEVAVPA